jgi:hypothetical protein
MHGGRLFQVSMVALGLAPIALAALVVFVR